ncbi:MAG: AmmeMemoRadiSam system protein B [Desulfosarcinaceae bacterium]|nr:AmmeMemoRadiSam system protein B [Desulfosarcinaceae bacterium]
MQLRKAMFAGSWYPDRAEICQREIDGFLAEGRDWASPEGALVGGVVPHAGWYYSGSLACNVIQRLAASTDTDLVAIFGMHLPRGAANVMMADGAWETPFGPLAIATEIAADLKAQFRFDIETAIAFQPDNTIELQLPFIKYFLPDARILPIGIPPQTASLPIGTAVVKAAQKRGLSLKVIGSTDLTHYGRNYGMRSHGSGAEALTWVRDRNDRRIIEAMLALDGPRIIDEARDHQNACCAGAAATAVTAAAALGATNPVALHYTTSHEKSPGDSFVGYVGILM